MSVCEEHLEVDEHEMLPVRGHMSRRRHLNSQCPCCIWWQKKERWTKRMKTRGDKVGKAKTKATYVRGSASRAQRMFQDRSWKQQARKQDAVLGL